MILRKNIIFEKLSIYSEKLTIIDIFLSNFAGCKLLNSVSQCLNVKGILQRQMHGRIQKPVGHLTWNILQK